MKHQWPRVTRCIVTHSHDCCRYIYGGREEPSGPVYGLGSVESDTNKVKSSLVLEPTPVNTDITSPGAILALGAHELIITTC